MPRRARPSCAAIPPGSWRAQRVDEVLAEHLEVALRRSPQQIDGARVVARLPHVAGQHGRGVQRVRVIGPQHRLPVGSASPGPGRAPGSSRRPGAGRRRGCWRPDSVLGSSGPNSSLKLLVGLLVHGQRLAELAEARAGRPRGCPRSAGCAGGRLPSTSRCLREDLRVQRRALRANRPCERSTLAMLEAQVQGLPVVRPIFSRHCVLEFRAELQRVLVLDRASTGSAPGR